MRAASVGRVPGPKTQTVLVDGVKILVVVTPGPQPIEPGPLDSEPDSEPDSGTDFTIGIIDFETRRKRVVEVKLEGVAAEKEGRGRKLTGQLYGAKLKP